VEKINEDRVRGIGRRSTAGLKLRTGDLLWDRRLKTSAARSLNGRGRKLKPSFSMKAAKNWRLRRQTFSKGKTLSFPLHTEAAKGGSAAAARVQLRKESVGIGPSLADYTWTKAKNSGGRPTLPLPPWERPHNGAGDKGSQTNPKETITKQREIRGKSQKKLAGAAGMADGRHEKFRHGITSPMGQEARPKDERDSAR